jgi:hypothetical protein
MKHLLFLLLSLLTSFSLCMSVKADSHYRIEKIMTSWLDEPIDKVITSWGMPDEEKSIMGQKMYVWHHEKHSLTGFLTPTHKWFCDRLLTVNEESKVTRADSYGNNCPFGAVTREYHDWANWDKYKKVDIDATRVKHRSATTY